QALATRLRVDDVVTFGGFVPDPELRHLLHVAGCAVIPSLYEPFGIVALEALAAGAPLVAAATGGLTEILGGTEAGLLYPAGDATALAAAVARVFTEPGVAERCRNAAEALVTGPYSWDSVAAATMPVYERVVGPAAR
ncbi:MAG TPA: glycosyltransferase, partial [Acidimicrobiales bacterium]